MKNDMQTEFNALLPSLKKLSVLKVKDPWYQIRVKKIISTARRWLMDETGLNLKRCQELKETTPIRFTALRTRGDIYFSIVYNDISVEFGKEKA